MTETALDFTDYRLTIRVKNNRILERIEEMGFSSVSSFCREYGLRDTEVGGLINLRWSATMRNRGHQWRKLVLRLSEIFKVLPEDLFAESQLNALKKNTVHIKLDESSLSAMGYNSKLHRLPPETAIEIGQGLEILEGALGTLNPREQSIVRRRYGLDTGEEMTYQQIADEEGRCPQRIRQIEMGALRKLRGRKNLKDSYAVLDVLSHG